MTQVTIQLCLDDSGKLNANDDWTVYAGLVFYQKESRNSFIRKYKSAVESLKCKYCHQKPDSCTKKCPELKSNVGIHPRHRRRLLNIIKNEYTYAIVINNNNVYPHILSDKHSRGRYIDYAHKMIIKQIIRDLIAKNIIDRNDDIRLFLYFDEQPTLTNGYYDLSSSIREELLYGITNYNYNISFRPTLAGKLEISLCYFDSRFHYDIQAADMLAGTIRHIAISKNQISDKKDLIKKKVTTVLFMP